MTATLEHDRPEPPGAGPAPDPRRFRALAIIAVAQLMIVLDGTVVTIALPSAQRALHISVANRQWVLTAYTLTFGGLLLLGGRIADYLGRKRMFVLSLLGFAAASALGGLAQNAAMLFGARALQGAMAAVMAPAALSLITVTFTESRERARAFGVYGAVAGGGAAVGLILGGLLTQYASWRWTLLDQHAHRRRHRHPGAPVREREPGHGTGGVRRARGPHRHRRPAGARVRLHPGRHRRLGILHHARIRGGRCRAPRLLRGGGAPHHPPPPPFARPHGQEPRRLVPGVALGGHRHVRLVPVPHLLLPGHPRVLGHPLGLRLPALLRGHHRRRRHRQPVPATRRPRA